MFNHSEHDRKNGTLTERILAYWDAEVYLAGSVADYRDARDSHALQPSWFKPLEQYAYIVLFNVNIDSGLVVMAWTTEGSILPAEKPYLQMLQEGELRQRDRVYRIVARHFYEKSVPFVASVNKFRPIRKHRTQDSAEWKLVSGIEFAP